MDSEKLHGSWPYPPTEIGTRYLVYDTDLLAAVDRTPVHRDKGTVAVSEIDQLLLLPLWTWAISDSTEIVELLVCADYPR
jgi:hypothetical protein